MDAQIPELSEQEIRPSISKATISKRKWFPKLLRNHVDEFNQVFNFMMRDPYMQPHLHPSAKKIYLIEGRVAALFFDDMGKIAKRIFLEKGGIDLIEAPAFTWHTYVMLPEHAITYETIRGIYNSETWKKFAEWVPQEDSLESSNYLAS
jgi:cupin fold WbuC family metalloprotein